MNHGKLRKLAVRHLDRSLLVWLVVFLSLVSAKTLGVAKNPWGIVLAPLWLPPIVLVGWQLTRLLRIALVLLLALLLGL